MTTRWMITGERSGPSNPAGNYTRNVHREVTKDAQRAKWCTDHNIPYSDGTMLYLSVRPMGHGERSKEPMKNGYGSLISDCVRHDCNDVERLCEIQDRLRAERAAKCVRVTS